MMGVHSECTEFLPQLLLLHAHTMVIVQISKFTSDSLIGRVNIILLFFPAGTVPFHIRSDAVVSRVVQHLLQFQMTFFVNVHGMHRLGGIYHPTT